MMKNTERGSKTECQITVIRGLEEMTCCN